MLSSSETFIISAGCIMLYCHPDQTVSGFKYFAKSATLYNLFLITVVNRGIPFSDSRLLVLVVSENAKYRCSSQLTYTSTDGFNHRSYQILRCLEF